MTREKSLYQTKLIIDCLPKEEYDLIPQDIIEYLEKNMQYDETIKIDSNIELGNQNIDEKTYEMLDKILKRINIKPNVENSQDNQLTEKEQIISLQNIISNLTKENAKIGEAKNLILEYRKQLSVLNEKCNYLEEALNSIPSFIKIIFIKKDKHKRLGNGIN